jgi:XPA protein C-terminus
MAGVNLDPELEERIRRNRARALTIQAERKRKLEGERQPGIPEELLEQPKQQNVEDYEDWEVGLSEWVTKKEAVSMYCLPEGTLVVCETREKENPHRKGWRPMKLYRRAEVRERSYERHGGKEGLVQERNKRVQKKLNKDLDEVDNIFESK